LTCFGIRRSILAASLCALAAASLAAGCGGGSAAPGRRMADLTNPFLGPEYSSWLVGPVARLATPAEVKAYLAVQDDAQAQAFIDRFWQSRNPTPDRPVNPLRDTFEKRAAEADRLYSEAGYLGRRTDRGAVYVLYGPPQKTEYQSSPDPGNPNLEVWTYGPGSPAGLDGKRPMAQYRFVKRGDLTVNYVPGMIDPRLQRPQLDPYGA
jgi:GWxTD domain-containing protein